MSQDVFIRHVATQILDIATDVKTSDSIQEEDTPSLIFSVDSKLFYLLARGNIKLYQLSKQILRKKEEWTSKFSEGYIREELEPLLVKASLETSPDIIIGYTSQFINTLENYSQKQTVYLPIASLTMKIDDLKIGEITLRNMTHRFIEKLITDAVATEIRLDMLQYQKEDRRQLLRQLFEEYPRSSSWSRGHDAHCQGKRDLSRRCLQRRSGEPAGHQPFYQTDYTSAELSATWRGAGDSSECGTAYGVLHRGMGLYPVSG